MSRGRSGSGAEVSVILPVGGPVGGRVDVNKELFEVNVKMKKTGRREGVHGSDQGLGVGGG